MEALTLALCLLAAVLLSSIVDQLVPKVSLPLIQIVLGILIALLASSSITFTLDPELFLVLFIAPLLYDEAKKADKIALWKNIKPVLSLAIGLVILTTAVIGFSVHALIPYISIASALMLGAALGPTDAVAVTSLSKSIKMPERQKSILKGELLLNDASGIVSFQFALAAAVTGTFSIIDASFDFAVEFFGGLLVGIILGYLANFVVRWARDIGVENTMFHVLFEVFIPLMVYLIADTLHTSGIIAVVVAGLFNVIAPRKTAPSVARMNIVSSSVWRVLSFGLNGVVFVLLGTQLPKVMQSTWEDVSISNVELIGYILFITFLLLCVRFIWISAMELIHHRSVFPDQQFFRADVKNSLLTTLAGPKGTITLSIMFTIPYYVYFSDGTVSAFPQRDLLIFLACGVIVCTLLISTFLTPLLVPKRDIRREEEEQHACDVEATMEVIRRVIEEVMAHQTPANRAATRVVISSYNERLSNIKDRNNIEDDTINALRVEALHWERAFTQNCIDTHSVSEDVGERYLHRLKRIERLLKHSYKDTFSWENLVLKVRLFFQNRHFISRFVRRIARTFVQPSVIEETTELHTLQIQSGEHVIGKLQSLITDSDIAAENATELILEYQRAISSLKNVRPSVTNIARTADIVDDVRRLAYATELEQIQTMYEDEKMSRTTANRLRENVRLMQLDLEETV